MISTSLIVIVPQGILLWDRLGWRSQCEQGAPGMRSASSATAVDAVLIMLLVARVTVTPSPGPGKIRALLDRGIR